MAVADQGLADLVGKQFENVVLVFLADFLPGDQAILFGQRRQDQGDRYRRQAPEQRMQFDDVLLLDHAFDDFVARHLLAAHHIFDEPMLAEKVLHLGQLILQFINFIRDDFVIHGEPMLRCKTRILAPGKCQFPDRMPAKKKIFPSYGTSAPAMRPRMMPVLRPRPGAPRLRS